jgi:transposase
MRPKNQGRPITKVTILEVQKLHKQGLTAKQIALKVGRSEIAVYNIFRVFITNNKFN